MHGDVMGNFIGCRVDRSVAENSNLLRSKAIRNIPAYSAGMKPSGDVIPRNATKLVKLVYQLRGQLAARPFVGRLEPSHSQLGKVESSFLWVPHPPIKFRGFKRRRAIFAPRNGPESIAIKCEISKVCHDDSIGALGATRKVLEKIGYCTQQGGSFGRLQIGIMFQQTAEEVKHNSCAKVLDLRHIAWDDVDVKPIALCIRGWLWARHS